MYKLFNAPSIPVMFDARLLIGEINSTKTVEEITENIEQKAGKKFQHLIVHDNVVQMVGNIFKFFSYSNAELKNDLIRSANIVSKMKQ